jgi:hypothetical protein
VDGEEIVVHPGTFLENINFNGKNIVLRSTDPHDWDVVKATVIDGNENGSVVTFAGSELSTCTLSGFTITNGRNGSNDLGYGGGINGNTSRSIIERNMIIDNYSSAFGGGLYQCDGFIHHNVISNNRALGSGAGDAYGGGMYDCNGAIQNNIIANNSAASISSPYSSAGGGGMASCDGYIINNTLYANSVFGSFGAVGGNLYSCGGVIANNIIWIGGFYSSSTPSYCCIRDWSEGGIGNISLDPLFVDASNGDFHLLPNSPCIDMGGSVNLYYDLDGNARPLDGDGLGAGTTGDGSDYDIGAYEYR